MKCVVRDRLYKTVIEDSGESFLVFLTQVTDVVKKLSGNTLPKVQE